MPQEYQPRELIGLLKEHGFEEVPNRRNDHIKLKKDDKLVVVPDGKQRIRDGTLRGIIKSSGLSRDVFFPGENERELRMAERAVRKEKRENAERGR